MCSLHTAEKQLHSPFFHLTQKMLPNMLQSIWSRLNHITRVVGKTECQGNGCDTSRVAEAIRVNVKITHGPFAETAPTYHSNLQLGNTLSPVAPRE